MDTRTKKANKRENNLTPLMQQYQNIKTQYPGLILLFRLGDFYEMFGEDAVKASPILEVVLTKRQNYPMCGVPHHSVNSYIKKLIAKGEKVAICEQLEEPRPGLKIVKRGVVRVITPGTIIEDHLLESKQNNYLISLYPQDKIFGLAYVDISTGEFAVTETNKEKLRSELFKLNASEIIIPDTFKNDVFLNSIKQQSNISFSEMEDWHFSAPEAQSKILQNYKTQSLKPFGLDGKSAAVSAAGAILAYIEKTQISQMPPLSNIKYYSLEDYMLIDEIAVRNLELVQNQQNGSREDSLLGTIDFTLTPMGSRLLRQWILRPLLSVDSIISRQQAARYFVEDGISRRQVRDDLKHIADIERILSRISSGAVSPRELISLKESLKLLRHIAQNIQPQNNISDLSKKIKTILSNLAAPEDIIEIIENSIQQEAPATLKDGNVIKNGYNPELDELRKIRREGKTFISEIENKEKQRTGITSLKIGYTSVFGYYIEVTKSYLNLVPQEYIRKQTVANGERYITPELKTLEEKILTAEEKIIRIEENIFRDIRNQLLMHQNKLQEIAYAIAELDIYCSFAETATQYNYCIPEINEDFDIQIKDGRHPVVERKIKSGTFVPNDTTLNSKTEELIILTGPNMAGKSTYLRQVALITIMAQIGSYVPAASAKIGKIDRIFTRIGAADNLASGESTFMVEMHETANILNQFTSRSLIILDEVGRGTSTYDGISIARAVIEYLVSTKEKNSPKVLFATHYFELTDLSSKHENIKNYNVAVKEWQGDVVFLHKIVPGSADRSYGIHVAQLAGLPQTVISRANNILKNLEQSALEQDNNRNAPQLDFFSHVPAQASEIISELEKLDINNLTPVEAIKILSSWKEKK